MFSRVTYRKSDDKVEKKLIIDPRLRKRKLYDNFYLEDII